MPAKTYKQDALQWSGPEQRPPEFGVAVAAHIEFGGVYFGERRVLHNGSGWCWAVSGEALSDEWAVLRWRDLSADERRDTA